MSYQKILLALELHVKKEMPLLNKAKTLADQFGAELFLVHAVEYLSHYGLAYGMSLGVDVEAELMQESKALMGRMVEVIDGILPQHQIIQSGSAKQVILEVARQKKVDLIIVGSHGRLGVQLLLGSTANAVLHSAQCDVLAVRLDSSKRG